jgi:hypothetical protein
MTFIPNGINIGRGASMIIKRMTSAMKGIGIKILIIENSIKRGLKIKGRTMKILTLVPNRLPKGNSQFES